MPASDRPPSCALKSIRLAHVAIACAILLSAAATVRVATHHGSNPDAGLPTGVRGWRILYHSRSVAGGGVRRSYAGRVSTVTSSSADRG